MGCNCWAYAVGVADVPMLPPVPPTAYPMGFPMDDDGNPEAGELVTPNGQPTGDNVYPADPKAHLHVLGEVAEGILKASGYYEVVECSLPINEPDLVVLIYSAGKNDDGTANCEDIQLRHGARSVGNNQYDTKNGFIFPPVEGMEGTNDGATGMLNGYFAPISLERNPRTGEMDRVGKVVCYKKR